MKKQFLSVLLIIPLSLVGGVCFSAPDSVEHNLAMHNKCFKGLWEKGRVEESLSDIYFLGLMWEADMGPAVKPLINRGVSEIQKAGAGNDRDSVRIGFWTLGLAFTVSKVQKGHRFSREDFPAICSRIERIEIGPLKDEMMLLAGLKEALFITEKLNCDAEVSRASASVLYPRAGRVLKMIREGHGSLCEEDKRLALAWLYSVVYRQSVPDWFVEKMWLDLAGSSVNYDDWWRMVLSVQLASQVSKEQSIRLMNKNYKTDDPVLCHALLKLFGSRTLIPIYGERFDEAMTEEPDYLKNSAYLRFFIAFLGLRG